jgi:hypothetical protein
MYDPNKHKSQYNAFDAGMLGKEEAIKVAKTNYA